MSRHHVRIKHNAAAAPLRKEWARLLPVPCLHCGRPVLEGQRWDLAHINAAESGGATTRGNTRPAHRSCNRRDGGKRGAAITNARRTTANQSERGLRAW